MAGATETAAGLSSGQHTKRQETWLLDSVSLLISHCARDEACKGKVLDSFGLQPVQPAFPALNYFWNQFSIDYSGASMRLDSFVRHWAAVQDGKQDFHHLGEHWGSGHLKHGGTAAAKTTKASQDQVSTTRFCQHSNTTQGRKHSHPRGDTQNPQWVLLADGRAFTGLAYSPLRWPF